MTRISDVEIMRLAEQDRLDRLKAPEERNRLGQFATPNSLAVEIAGYSLQIWGDRPGSVRFLDPSIGTASFYSAIRQIFPPPLIGSASGIEIDPPFAEAAIRLWGPMGLDVTAADFTRLDPPPIGRRFNLILANPPYVRHHHLDPEEKRRLKGLVGRRVGIDISGLAGFYAYFMLLGDAWLEENGISIWLIPSEFMDVNYGAAIRSYLTDRVRLLHIHRFSPADVQFGDALVTSAVVVFEKSPPTEMHAARMSFGGPLRAPETSEFVPLSDLRTAKKWTNYPRRSPATTDEIGSAVTLGDLFSIRRGIATGSNEFFIIPREVAECMGLPRRFLRPILPSPRHLSATIIEADVDGYPTVGRPMSLLDCDRPESEVRRDYPTLWAYLEEGIKKGVDRGYLASRRTPWYAQERREPSPFVCTYMGRRRGERSPFRIMRNESQAVAANVYLMLYPKFILKRELDANPGLYSAVFEILRAIDPDRFIDEGRVYGGGLHKVEPKELARLPAGPIAEAIGDPGFRQASLF